MNEDEAAERELQCRRIYESRDTLSANTKWISSTSTVFDGTYRHLLSAAKAKSKKRNKPEKQLHSELAPDRYRVSPAEVELLKLGCDGDDGGGDDDGDICDDDGGGDDGTTASRDGGDGGDDDGRKRASYWGSCRSDDPPRQRLRLRLAKLRQRLEWDQATRRMTAPSVAMSRSPVPGRPELY